MAQVPIASKRRGASYAHGPQPRRKQPATAPKQEQVTGEVCFVIFYLRAIYWRLLL